MLLNKVSLDKMKIFNVVCVVVNILQIAIAEQKVLSFLSLYSSAETDQDSSQILTSPGIVSAGIEEVDYNLSSFSDSISESLHALDSKLTSSITLDYEATIIILNSSIEDKLNQIDDLELNIQKLQSELSENSNRCDVFSTCKGCSMNENCVWCKTEHKCVSGDSNGPFHGECTEFAHRNCNEIGCEQYLSCENCMANPSCGWCDNALYCMKGDRTNTGGCDPVFFYHAYLPGKDYCPSELSHAAKTLRLHERNFSDNWTASPVDSYISNNPTLSKSRRIHDLQTEIATLQQKRGKLQAEVEELEFSKRKLLKEANEAVGIGVPSAYVPIRTKNLSQYADYIKQAEDTALIHNFEDLKGLINKQIKEDKYRISRDSGIFPSDFMQPVSNNPSQTSQPTSTQPEHSQPVSEAPKSSSRSESISNNLKLESINPAKHH